MLQMRQTRQQMLQSDTYLHSMILTSLPLQIPDPEEMEALAVAEEISGRMKM